MISRPCRRYRKNVARRTEQRRRLHAATGSQGLPALPAPLMPTLPRPPQARLAIKTTSRSPLFSEPGWPTHTPKPNFGKVEYFSRRRIDRGRHRARTRSPDGTPAQSATVPNTGEQPRIAPFAPPGPRAMGRQLFGRAETSGNTCLHSATFRLPKGHDRPASGGRPRSPPEDRKSPRTEVHGFQPI